MFLSHAGRDSVKTVPPCLWLLNPLPYTLHDGGSQDGMRISAYVPPVLGADAFQAYLLKIGEDNPLVIYEGHFWLGIAGWRVPCYVQRLRRGVSGNARQLSQAPLPAQVLLTMKEASKRERELRDIA